MNKSIFTIYDKRKKIINYFLIILSLCPSIAISISTFDIVNWLRYGKLTFVLNDLNELSLDKLSKLNISELITDLFVWVIAFPIFFPIFFIILIILLNKKLELVAFISK
jgi:preprotein translocase subunit SecE